jgi:hypothetical protein
VSIRGDVRQYFGDHKGEEVTLNELTLWLKYEPRVIQKTIGSLVRSGEPITIVERGQAWKYDGQVELTEPKMGRPFKAKTKKKVAAKKTVAKKAVVAEPQSTSRKAEAYHQVGETRKGEIVLEDKDGNILLARRTDFKFN